MNCSAEKLPWEERPASSRDVLWRYSSNPVVRRDATPTSNSVFNSAVVALPNGTFAGVFRVDNRAVQMRLHAAFSDDALTWRVDANPIAWQRPTGADLPEGASEDDADASLLRSDYGYDPRVVQIEGDDRFWITWCNGYEGPCIGLGFTRDFVSFYQCENALMPFNRNGVLFPAKINGRFAMLSRPSDNGHTKFGDIWLSYSKDLVYWGAHRHVMKPTPFEESAWQCTKVGAGCAPIRTDAGWLLIYHGVITTCNGFRYSIGAALLDLENPSKVLARTRSYLLAPTEIYEQAGDVPNVCFPVAALTDGKRIAIYYGAADTVVALCFGYIDEIVAFVKNDSI
jgi:beta-1,4-mannooligosaccharide/beta-1,4-mannosyl-N-acetylglucosamine phosphorylase